VRQTRVDLYV